MKTVAQCLEKLQKAKDKADKLGRLVIIFSLPPVEKVTDWLYWLSYGKEERN